MKQKIINLLEFKELNEEQKKQVLDNYRDINVEWMDDLTEQDDGYRLKVEEAGFLEPTFCYDISCSQGRGASFDCRGFDYNKLLADWDYHHKNWIIAIMEQYGDIEIYRNHYANYYSHSKTRHIDGGLSKNAGIRIEEAVEVALRHIETKRLELCDEILDMLEKDYEYLTSDEAVAETLEANEYLFNEETLRIDY